MSNLISKGPSTLAEVIGYEQQKSWQKHKKHRQNNDHGKNRVVMSGLFVYSAQWGQIFYEIIFESVSHSSANFWILNCGYKKGWFYQKKIMDFKWVAVFCELK